MTGVLNLLDYAILLAYIVGTLWVGFRVGAKLKGGEDYFLAGRSLPWWAIGFSLVATDIGGTDIIGGGGSAYRYGIAIANFEWIGCIPAMIVAAFVFIPFLWRSGVYTIPEYMERRYGPRVRAVLAAAWIVIMACNLGLMLVASAKMMTPLLGWSEGTSIVVMAVLVGVYTWSGGLAAVVYTDVLQCVIMIVGCLVVAALGVIDLGGFGPIVDRLREMDRVRAAASGPEFTSLVLPVDTSTPFPWSGIFFGLALVLSPAYWIGNQAIVQRALGAKNEYQAKASYVWGALLKNVIPLIYALPGLIALVKFPGLADGDQAIPTLVAKSLPGGVRGLFLAAFLAALMSSVDSYLNSAATILTSDLYRRFLRPRASDADLLRVGRWTTIALTIWSIGFAFLLNAVGSPAVYAVFQTLMAFVQGPMLALLLAGLFWRRATAEGAFLGFLAGVGTAALLFALNLESVRASLGIAPLFRIETPYLYFAVWSFVAAVTVLAAVSLLTPPEPETKIGQLIYRRRGGAGR